MLFAELDANGWVIIIAAIFLGLGQLLTIWRNSAKLDEVKEQARLEGLRSKAAVEQVHQQATAAKAEAIAAKVQAAIVADKQDIASDKQDIASGKQDAAEHKLGEIHELTNSRLSRIEELLKEAREKIAALEHEKVIRAEAENKNKPKV